MENSKDTHQLIKEAYGKVARQSGSSCCNSSGSCCTGNIVTLSESDLGLSCGNPVSFSVIRKGDMILDLGSGAGRDVFIAAELTGPTGKVIGVDMTSEMLDLARNLASKFSAKVGYSNVEFREGYIEDLPVDDNSIDLVISNCVINLSVDKPKVFREILRVLMPGGRMVVSDIVLNKMLPESLKNDPNLYVSCVAGALQRDDYLNAIMSAGFINVEIMNDIVWETSNSKTDPITCNASEILDGVASSITVSAFKQ